MIKTKPPLCYNSVFPVRLARAVRILPDMGAQCPCGNVVSADFHDPRSGGMHGACACGLDVLVTPLMRVQHYLDVVRGAIGKGHPNRAYVAARSAVRASRMGSRASEDSLRRLIG